MDLPRCGVKSFSDVNLLSVCIWITSIPINIHLVTHVQSCPAHHLAQQEEMVSGLHRVIVWTTQTIRNGLHMSPYPSGEMMPWRERMDRWLLWLSWWLVTTQAALIQGWIWVLHNKANYPNSYAVYSRIYDNRGLLFPPAGAKPGHSYTSTF